MQEMSNKGHYTKLCRTTTVGIAEEEEHFLGSVLLGNLSKHREKEKIIDWQAEMEDTTAVSSKIINFGLDTGADVPVVPGHFFRRNFPIIQKDR